MDYEKREYLSVSSLMSFARCPRYYYYGSGLRLEEAEGERNYFLFGEALHKGVTVACLKGVDEAMVEFDMVWDEVFADEKRNRARAIEMLHSARKTFLATDWELREPPGGALRLNDKVSEYEIPIAVDIGLPVPLVVRIDAWGWDQDSQEEMVVEFKTSSEVSGRFMEGFEGSVQLMTYVMALSQALGREIRRAHIFVMRVSKSNAETRIQPVRFTDHQLEKNLGWLRELGSQLLACEEHCQWPCAFSGCNPYTTFGQPGYTCDYFPLCHYAEDWRELGSLYRQRGKKVFELLSVKEAAV